MPSSNDFSRQALQLLNIIQPGEDPSAEDGELAHTVLNQWVDSLALQRSTKFFLARTATTLVSGTASYTIGTGGTINIVRPTEIDQGQAMLVIDTSASTPTEVPLHVLTDDEYAAWGQKALQSSLPGAIWYDHNWSAGLGRIYPLPIPNVGTTQLVLYTPTAITQFADQSTNYTFAPGYERTIVLNLTRELKPYYPAAKPDPDIWELAKNSMADVKRGNLRLSHVRIDPTLTRKAGTLSRMRFLSGDI